MRVLLLICMPVLLAQAQYQEQVLFPDANYYYSPELFGPESQNPDTFPESYQQQVQIEPAVVPEKSGPTFETEPTEPGPLDCREEQYPCTRLYSVHKPCKQCLNSLCFYSLRRVYVINKEICMRTVCAHEELLRADLCRDQFSRCGVMALSGQCASIGGSCGKSCGGC
ncbi:microfibrillar-associated protein 2 isoform X1 [Girardinichthys multiradiatus]|uniref:Microfibrillar-associated protein 2 n=4 Tax=Goodeidae TaxID=28758 RepID=A0AAV9RXV4_9TELE|nr:microfibrillar-associated protein 2 isoform X1 [Girardinichthys multiradiatus]XP_047203443.1 microfibrillar-associated protein 2 isoform X1 [Girardinichthys multiradiatus]